MFVLDSVFGCCFAGVMLSRWMAFMLVLWGVFVLRVLCLVCLSFVVVVSTC